MADEPCNNTTWLRLRLHQWTKWEDRKRLDTNYFAEGQDKPNYCELSIVQERRCQRCNMAELRTTKTRVA